MADPVALVAMSDLPDGRGRRVCRAGLDLAVFKVGDAVYAIDDSCPHAGASLANGRLHGAQVTCPAHGLKFHLYGNGAVESTALGVRCHRVEVIDGMVVLHPAPRSE